MGANYRGPLSPKTLEEAEHRSWDEYLAAMLVSFRETCVKHLEEVKAREERRKKEGN